jgi:3-hydroxy-9,10-secoandrosta-1,3,5(10)-triene-9,17-dione monooxygenase reductase component
MTIHTSNPFATPEGDRSPLRRLRGRLPAPVTLWTAPGPAGLTVSSTMIVDGEPGRVLGLVDDESELWAAIEEVERFAVVPLRAGHRQLADRFAGVLPAPGGPFRVDRFTETGYGPVPEGDATWAGCRFDAARPYGWGLLVEGTVEHIEIGASDEPLLYYRGRYRELR